MRWILILGIVTPALVTAAWLGLAFSQESELPPRDSPIEREKLFLSGWDPDEPVPAYLYYQKGKKSLPVVIFVRGVSMGSSTCMVLAWREPRISVVVGFIGAVDFWYDVTKTPPGADQDSKRNALSPRVRQLVTSLDPRDRKTAIAPKALFLA